MRSLDEETQDSLPCQSSDTLELQTCALALFLRGFDKDVVDVVVSLFSHIMLETMKKTVRELIITIKFILNDLYNGLKN